MTKEIVKVMFSYYLGAITDWRQAIYEPLLLSSAQDCNHKSFRFFLMSENGESTECAVCRQKTPKTRVHYGGVSCYSCRAFFRRNTRSGKTIKCKIDQNCAVSYMEHKQCMPCRYQKCLR